MVQTLPSDLPSAHEKILTLYRENEYLKEQLRLTRARIFGRSSEKQPKEGSSAQVLLFTTTEPAKPEPAPTKIKEHVRRKKVEGKLPDGIRFPEHLPREDDIIDEGEGEVKFEKITERLAAYPSQFYVKRIVRRVRGTVDGSIKTPAVPPAVLERTAVDVSFLVYVLVAKYVWHLPLYRQEQILKAQGIQISRDTLIRYVISLASLLKPIYVALGVELFSSNHLFADETPVMVGKLKGSKSYSESWFWAFLGDSGCAFYHTPSRAFVEVDWLLKSFSGHLQSDGYSVYEKLAREYPEITIVSCWAHARRKFVDAEKGGNAPEATEALRYIRALYRVESRIRDHKLKAPQILHLRQRFSRKILKLLERWLKQKAQDPTLLPKSLFGAAVAYTLKRWDALSLYADNPTLAIDSNAVEREIRPIALGKKNWLFCASEVGAEASAIIYSLTASCRLAGINPADYFTDVLERISEHPASKVLDLIPVNWKNLKIQHSR